MKISRLGRDFTCGGGRGPCTQSSANQDAGCGECQRTSAYWQSLWTCYRYYYYCYSEELVGWISMSTPSSSWSNHHVKHHLKDRLNCFHILLITCHVCPVAGAQGPPIRILYDFPDHYKDIRKEIRIRILLGYGILHAMRRHKAWRSGSNAQQSCVPATALSS